MLKLDRPDRKNALTAALAWSIVRALADAQADDEVRIIEVVKAGRAFSLHQVTVSQASKIAVMMMCSFTRDTDGYEYDVSGIPVGVPLPDDVPLSGDDIDDDYPWDTRWVGPTPAREDGTRCEASSERPRVASWRP